MKNRFTKCRKCKHKGTDVCLYCSDGHLYKRSPGNKPPLNTDPPLIAQIIGRFIGALILLIITAATLGILVVFIKILKYLLLSL